jgi:hypothetical protein
MSHISSIGAGMYTDLSVAFPSTDYNFSTAGIDTPTEWQTLFLDEVTTNGAKGVGTYVRIQNVREFPSIGTPANIVNVPVYGAKTSRQVQGQADSPTIELTLNYVPSDWATGTLLGNSVGNGVQYGFRFSLLNSAPINYSSGAAITPSASTATTVTSIANAASAEVGQILVNTATPATKYGRITSINTGTGVITFDATGFSGGTPPATGAGAITAVGIGEVANSQWYWYGKMESLLVNPQLTDANTATLTISVQSDFYGAYTSN